MHFYRSNLISFLYCAMMLVMPASAHPGNGIVVDSTGRVFFLPQYSAQLAQTIYCLEADGTVRLWLDDQRIFERHDLFLDDQERLITAARGVVWRMDTDQKTLHRLHPPRSWQGMKPPEGVWRNEIVVAEGGDPFAMDPRGNLYAAVRSADDQPEQILKISASGAVQMLAGGGPRFADGRGRQAGLLPLHLARLQWGPGDRLYLTNTTCVRRIAADGTVSTIAGSGQSGFRDGTGSEARFAGASGFAFDAAGNLLVADTPNQRLRRVTTRGVATTIAGTGQTGRHDGAAQQATFTEPGGVAVDAEGNIYILEDNGMRVRRLSTAGIVSTVAELKVPERP